MQDSRSLRSAARRAKEAQYRAEAARHVLRVAIREARAEGMTLRAIAGVTNLSFGRVHQIERGAENVSDDEERDLEAELKRDGGRTP